MQKVTKNYRMFQKERYQTNVNVFPCPCLRHLYFVLELGVREPWITIKIVKIYFLYALYKYIYKKKLKN